MTSAQDPAPARLALLASAIADRPLRVAVALEGEQAYTDGGVVFVEAGAPFEEQRRPDGTWRVDGKWWRAPGSKGSNVEVVDWGETAHERLTARAFEVLAAANRLQAGAV